MEDAAYGWRRFVDAGAPLAVGLYYDLADKEELIDQLNAACRPVMPRISRDAFEVLTTKEAGVVLLDPADVGAALELLEPNRDRLAMLPVKVVLLLSTGDGVRTLGSLPALESWVRDHTFGNYAIEERPDEARDAFAARAGGLMPEAFLDRWKRGECEDTADNNALVSEALFLDRGHR